jgi:deazaflavin-dependent oxidoreductase (nitroreductase family)
VHQSQRIEQTWDTPAMDQILQIARSHIAALEQSDADAVWRPMGMHHVLLTLTGRRSGSVRKVALPFWRDAEDVPIVVASFAGADRHPDWFVNLRDTAANPTVHCRFQHSEHVSVPQILTGAERHAVWAQLVADRAWYAEYQSATAREIPLVRLPAP